jgi:hypothetical protein
MTMTRQRDKKVAMTIHVSPDMSRKIRALAHDQPFSISQVAEMLLGHGIAFADIWGLTPAPKAADPDHPFDVVQRIEFGSIAYKVPGADKGEETGR